MNDHDRIEKITRSLAYMLRHRPDEFDLEVDAHGFAEMGEVVRALNERLGEPVEEGDVIDAIESGDRPRYEIRGDKIRALYGHSIPVEPGPDSQPPEVLYLGIPTRDVERARKYGLRARRRSFLHLALTPEDAAETGRRAAREYTVLEIHALDAWEDGVNFYDRTALWLADEIPADMVEVHGSFDDGVEPHRGGPGGGPRGGRGDGDREERGRRGGRRRRGGRGGRRRDFDDEREERPRDDDEGEEFEREERGGRAERDDFEVRARRDDDDEDRVDFEREERGGRAEREVREDREPGRLPRSGGSRGRGRGGREERSERPRRDERDERPTRDERPSRDERDERPRRDDERAERPRRDREERGGRDRGDRERGDRERSDRGDRERGDRERSDRGDRERSDRERGDRERGDRGDRERSDRGRSGPERAAPRRAAPAAAEPERRPSTPDFGLGVFEPKQKAPARDEAPAEKPVRRKEREEPRPEPAEKSRSDDEPTFGAGL
ncbi:MAG: RNA 2'-phosphotransferase [Planctomycetota bacterium]